MTQQEFVNRIMGTPCEECPIEIYCRICKAFSCHSTARQYYVTHKRPKEVFKWPDKICTTIQTNTITRKR